MVQQLQHILARLKKEYVRVSLQYPLKQGRLHLAMERIGRGHGHINSKLSKKIVILLSDGVNNAGVISPNEAIEFAKANVIQVYYRIGL